MTRVIRTFFWKVGLFPILIGSMGLVYFMDNVTRTPGQWSFNVFFHGILFASGLPRRKPDF